MHFLQNYYQALFNLLRRIKLGINIEFGIYDIFTVNQLSDILP